MKRIFYYDNLKGLLILCVVLWHTLSICSGFYGFNNDISKIISFFMIPLFIFTTGKFAKTSKKPPIKRALKMFLIFLVAQILITIYFRETLGIISNSDSYLVPRFTLWYLITTSILYLSEYIFRKFKFSKVFIISIILGLTSGFVGFISDTLSLSRTIGFFPFFILGYYSDEIKLIEKANKKQIIISILTLFIKIWFIFNPEYFLFKDTYLKYNYYEYATALECFSKRFLIYLIFFIFSMFILIIIPKSKTFLCYFGTKTLIIYLFHGAILKTMNTYEIFINDSLIGTIMTYLIVIILCLTIDYIFKHVKTLDIPIINKMKIKVNYTKNSLLDIIKLRNNGKINTKMLE